MIEAYFFWLWLLVADDIIPYRTESYSTVEQCETARASFHGKIRPDVIDGLTVLPYDGVITRPCEKE